MNGLTIFFLLLAFILAGIVIFLLVYFWMSSSKNTPIVDDTSAIDQAQKTILSSLDKQAQQYNEQYANLYREHGTTNLQINRLQEQMDFLAKQYLSPNIRGQIGEVHLKTIIENCFGSYPDMVKFQPTIKNFRPDSVINLGKNIGSIIIDCKFPKILEEENNESNLKLMTKNMIVQIRNTAKYYNINDFNVLGIILFIPNEKMFLEFVGNVQIVKALSKYKITMCGPSNLCNLIYFFQSFYLKYKFSETILPNLYENYLKLQKIIKEVLIIQEQNKKHIENLDENTQKLDKKFKKINGLAQGQNEKK